MLACQQTPHFTLTMIINNHFGFVFASYSNKRYIDEIKITTNISYVMQSLVALVVKNPPASAGDIRDADLIPGLRRYLGEGHDNPLQYPCLENRMDRETWWVTVHRVAKTQTWLRWLSTTHQLYYAIHLCEWMWLCSFSPLNHFSKPGWGLVSLFQGNLRAWESGSEEAPAFSQPSTGFGVLNHFGVMDFVVNLQIPPHTDTFKHRS